MYDHDGYIFHISEEWTRSSLICTQLRYDMIWKRVDRHMYMYVCGMFVHPRGNEWREAEEGRGEEGKKESVRDVKEEKPPRQHD